MHDYDFNGLWLHRESGATLQLERNGDCMTGCWTGGRWHETLRGRFTGERCGDGFEGDYVNHEGVVNGVGRMRVEVLGPDQIKFFGHGDWSGGGASGHVDGCSILDRAC